MFPTESNTYKINGSDIGNETQKNCDILQTTEGVLLIVNFP